MHFANTIRRWFSETKGGSLVLPDGWYGRPYDNQHALTLLDESRETLTIILDDKLTLHFEGLSKVETHHNELVIGPYDKVRFDWEGFGASNHRGSKVYQEGVVKIVSSPG